MQLRHLCFLLIASCTASGPAPFDTDVTDDVRDSDVPDIEYPDRDGDGSTADEDCDDQNPLVNPDMPEVCNGADDDCDGLSDASDAEHPDMTVAYQDSDIDTFGDEDTERWFCEIPSGWIAAGGDCDDGNAARSPGAIEVCNQVDDDCDGETDDDDDGLVAAGHPTAVQRFPDADGDGYGAGNQRWYCVAPSTGVADSGTDCDDADEHAFPGAAERESSTSCRRDVDGDGYGTPTVSGSVIAGTDCDDTIATTFPGAAQYESSSSCRADADDDGYGNKTPSGGVTAGGDCNDAVAATNPGAAEVWYDGVDKNCDGRDDYDQDGDGYAAPSKPGGGNDCNDTTNTVNPGRTEIAYNGVDDDCTAGDECDVDNDGTNAPNGACGGNDCADNDSAREPGNTEICDGKDNDCDNLVDQDDPGISTALLTAWWRDFDGDGYGDVDLPSLHCATTTRSGYAKNDDDCDDSLSAVKPSATEICNAIDDDCDADIDDADTSVSVTQFWYFDTDGDTFPGSANPTRTCAQPVGGLRLTAQNTDCDDSKATTFPGAAQNESSTSCRADADNDGYGSKTVPVGVTVGTDCNDDRAAAYPGATDTWYDGFDDNCDAKDDWDQDGDTFAAESKPGGTGTDCDDLLPAVKPTATEVCNSLDDDCDDAIDDADPNVSVTVFWYVDADGDTFAGSANPVRTCSQPSGGVRLAAATDCDDTSAFTFVGAAQIESPTTCRRDVDDDGYGASTVSAGVTAGTDCDDTVATTFRGSAERESTTTCRADLDGDGYGATTAPPGGVAGTDCNDAVATTFPGAAQIESSSACRADADDDGYGSTTAPAGGTAGGDCNDLADTIRPNAVEVWYDGTDQNCDAKDDWDQDGDTYAAESKPGGTGTDCDDLISAVRPNAVEECNLRDDDCDDLIDDDDGNVVVTIPWGSDEDGDGFPGSGTLFEVCMSPGGGVLPYTPTTADCDDDDPLTYIGAAFEESPTLCMTDADEDGWGSDLPLAGIAVGNDCDDLDQDIFPDAVEIWYDSIDQDCDPTNEWDRDGDGVPKVGAPGGGTDCDDADSALGSSTLDTDCDGALNTVDCNPADATKQCVVQQVATGIEHTCALFDNGRVRCWGKGDGGRLGYGNNRNVGDDETPLSVGDVSVGASVKQLALSGFHTCALRTDGTVSCWGTGVMLGYGNGNGNDIGDNELPSTAGTVSIGTTVAQITAGYEHTCVLTTGGAVKCWGRADYGALGYGNTNFIGDDETPASVGTVNVGSGVIRQVVAGGYRTCVLFDDGTVRCWGQAGVGALGLGHTNNIGDNESPGSVEKVSVGGTVTSLALGGSHTCAVLSTGAVRCWGANSRGQLGLGNTSNIGDDELPSSVGESGAVFDVVSVSAGASHTCVRRAAGGVRCWGYGLDGALGYGNTNNIGDNETPSGTVNTGVNARALFSGGNHNCVIGDATTEPVRCWGYNPWGLLGYGNTNNIGDNEHPSTAGNVTFR